MRLRTPVYKLVQYIDWSRIVRVLTAVLYDRYADIETVLIEQVFVFPLHSRLMSPAWLKLRLDLYASTTARSYWFVYSASLLSFCIFLRGPKDFSLKIFCDPFCRFRTEVLLVVQFSNILT